MTKNTNPGGSRYRLGVADDLSLLEAWQAGDREAGDRLLRRHAASIRRFFRNKVDTPRDVDELVQETFLQTVRAKDGFEGRAAFRTLLFTVARRQLFRFIERRHRRPVQSLASISIAALSTSPSQVAARAEAQRRVLQALRALDVDLQVAIELHYWEELSTAELAEVLGIPQGTVKSRLRRGREALASALASLHTAVGEPADVDAVARSLRNAAAG